VGVRKRLVTDTEAFCSSCKTMHPLDAFSKNSTEVDGLQYRCNNSNKKLHKNKMEQDPDYNALRAERRAKYRFNLTYEEYEEKRVKQDVCAICSTQLTSGKMGAHLDHCHKTGKVREFLCPCCYVGLGHFKDNTESLMSAIKYLDKHKEFNQSVSSL
jgi:hypothetical protein